MSCVTNTKIVFVSFYHFIWYCYRDPVDVSSTARTRTDPGSSDDEGISEGDDEDEDNNDDELAADTGDYLPLGGEILS